MQVPRFERLSSRALALFLLAGTASAQWPQWGGEDRNFHTSTTGLADAWPEAGPAKLWERALGPGYSSVVADGGLVFTLYQSGDDEVVIAMDAASGATKWEHRYPRLRGSEAPNATPAVAGGKVYALGVSGILNALDEKSGKLAWSHDLVVEHAAKRPQFGFAASPLAHEGKLLVSVGGKGVGVAAFALADGALLWKRHDLEEFYASPILVEVEGETQLVALAAHQMFGIDPDTGEKLWSEPIENDQNIATPVWCSNGLLVVTAEMGGSRGFRLAKVDGKTKVERVWKNQSQISQTTVVSVGDFLYGSAGDPCFVTAFDARTGETVWQEPGFSVANLVAAGDGKLVVLDYEGALGLATAGPDAWKVVGKATSVLTPQAFTPPTLAGKTLYLRDLEKVLALDLGKAQ